MLLNVKQCFAGMKQLHCILVHWITLSNVNKESKTQVSVTQESKTKRIFHNTLLLEKEKKHLSDIHKKIVLSICSIY